MGREPPDRRPVGRSARASDTPADARRRLADAMAQAHDARPGDVEAGRARVLLEGRVGDDERWDLSRLAPLFERWTFGE